jgi:adenine-specific DNA-methyltransferase
MWFPLNAPDGTIVYPIRNDGKEGRWRIGKDNILTKRIIEDTECAHWEIRPFDNGVEVDGKSERWVPYEKGRDTKRSFGWSTWLDSHGYNADATRELKDIFGEKVFDTPKPTQLVDWIVSVHQDDDALVLDSFAGSGTTAHAVLKLNKEDGGNRRFILVEMEPDVARTITAERVRRVANGYKNTKSENVAGLGGGFRFCELGEPLFDQNGKIHDSVSFIDLARHVYFSETGEPLPQAVIPDTPFLGTCRGVGIYLLYNGILGDKRANGGNVLTRAVLNLLPPFDGQKVIYCAGCLLGRERLQAERIIIRQTPYEIKTS